MTQDTKKALFIFGAGFLLFLIFKPKMKRITAETNLKYEDEADNPKNREKIPTPTMNAKSAAKHPLAKGGFIALKAYVDAYNNGEPQKVLDELNTEFAKEYKVKVYRRKSDKKLVVTDLNGNEIMVNNG